MHLAALVVGHRFAHCSRLMVEHGREAVDHCAGAGIVHLGQDHEAGGALDQRADRGTIALTLDQVALPVDRNKTVFDLGRTDLDALHVFDMAAPVDATAAPLSHLIMMPQKGDQFALEFAARVQVDRVVDRLMRDRFVRFVGPHGVQYVHNLLRRLARFQKLPYHMEERHRRGAWAEVAVRYAGLSPACGQNWRRKDQISALCAVLG